MIMKHLSRRALSVLLALMLVFTATVFTEAAAQPDDDAGTGAVDLFRDRDLAPAAASAELAATGRYDIIVGRVIVSDSNKNDILNDGGKVRYDPTSKVLTFSDPTVSEAYGDDFGLIQIQTDGVTLAGSFSMTGAISDFGLCVTDDYSVTIDGDFSFYGNECGIAVNETLTLSSGSVKAVGVDPDSTGICAKSLAVGDGVTKLEMQGGSDAYYGEHLIFGNNRITYPVDAFFSEVTGGIIFADYSGIADRAVIEPFTGTNYDLWLGSRRVTDENCSDIFGDGKASFDPAGGILTLDDPEIVGAHPVTVDTLSNIMKIYSCIDLTVKGSYHISESELDLLHPDDGSEDTDDLLGCLYCTEDLTLDGDFTFAATAFPVFSQKDITIKSGTVNVSGSASVGIGAPNGTITLENGITKIDAAADVYPMYAKVITCGSDLKVTNPAEGILRYFDESDVYVVCDSTGAAVSHAVIEYCVTQPTEPAVSYNVVLGDTPVTSLNKDDILGDGGKAKYDPVSKTLTLNDPAVNGVFTSGESTMKIASVDDIIIKGSYHMTSAEAEQGVYSGGSVTFDGDFTVMGTGFGVRAKTGVTVSQGSLKAVCTGSYGIYNEGGAFTVFADADRVEVQSSYAAVLSPSIVIAEGMTITSPAVWHDVEVTNTDIKFHTVIGDDEAIIKSLVISEGTAPAPTEPPTEPAPDYYGLWVGSVYVSSENADDILEDGGKAKYDPASKTLTLNDPVISDVSTSGTNTFKIYSVGDITVKGSYHMTSADAVLGIFSENGVTLDGDFTLMCTNYGVRAKNGITVGSGSLKVDCSGSYGIYNEGGAFTVCDGVDRVEVHCSYVALLSPSIALGSRVAVTSPELWHEVKTNNTEIEYHTLIDDDDQLVKDLIIERKGAVLGDADGSGEIDSIDATVMQRAIAFMHVPDSYDEAAADIDGDGEVTSVDVTYLQRWLAHMQIPYAVGE